MRKAVSLTLALALSGCATYHVARGPKPQVPKGIGSTDWSAVSALQPKRHYVFVTLDGGDIRGGILWSVGEATLTIFDESGERALPRVVIVRVVDHVQIGAKRPGWYPYVGVPIVTGILGGLTGVIVGAVQKNAPLRRVSWWTFALSLGVGLGLGPSAEYPRPIFEDRLVYVRP
jgi:hypothetical protein